MKLCISTIYASPQSEVGISSKIPALIAKKVNEKLMPLYGLDTRKVTWKLNLMITIDKNKHEKRLCEVEIYKKQRMENHVVWLPYNQLKGKNVVENYVEMVFEAITEVLERYQTQQIDILVLQKEVLQEISENPFYTYKPRYTPDLKAILDKVNAKTSAKI